MSADSDVLIELCELSKVYEQGSVQVRALDGLTLKIAKGAFTAITGPSGSGKTTALNLIGGLDLPTSGSVFLDGQRIDALSRAERAELRLSSIGLFFQAFNLIPVLSAEENVAFIMQLRGVVASERKRRAREILAEVGLEGMEDRRPGSSPGGSSSA